MTLGNQIPDEGRTLHRANATTMFWLMLLAFAAALSLFLLLQRLGLHAEIIVGSILFMTVTVVVGLAFTSRTMTGSQFFYANRTLGPFTSGLSSSSDILSGAMLVLLFSSSLAGKMLLATSLALGILFQAGMFSSAFQRSGVSGLPGYFAWRFQNQITGYLALIAVFGMLLLLSLAEMQVAKNILQIQTGIPLDNAVWFVLVLAVLPSLFGGWTGLLLVNATLVIWMLVCTLVPAIATGFFASMFGQSLQLDFLGEPLNALDLAPSTLLFGSSETVSVAAPVFTVLAIAAGISTLPQALSRLSTNNRAVDAIESVGWLALMVFLMLSALPLSLGLVVATPTSAKLASVLQAQPVLHMLPYFIVLFAAINALAATLFTAASSVSRATGRFRNLNPGEQSVFSTRLVILILAGLLLYWPDAWTPPTDHLLISALMLGTGGLFIPLLISTWLGSISAWAVSLSIACGTATTLLLLAPVKLLFTLSPITAGITGAAVALIVLIADRLWSKLRGSWPKLNSSAQYLRRH
ncbi:MAG: hypothetical protein GKR97_12705 [Rhizobiaceae bacterium]|nr:hypothetical protein [Rhizobiaceae bacterium]